ncbi:MAG: hypothetical protein RIC30_03960 [Marinoscillum sp.]|uniref:hypothetical protein n=1 Tax=Marinoscillum sp. TaxID=2024838 RepID=UPI0032FA9CE6
MISELRQSINATLYERVSSPLYGTLIISWIIWNWEIVYLTFFVSESSLEVTKLKFISDNYLNIHDLITFPILTSIFLLTVMPFASNGAYYLSLLFKKWRTDKRNLIENKQLLSIEKSIALREEIRSQEEKFDKLLDTKNEEIKILTQEVENYRAAAQQAQEKVLEPAKELVQRERKKATKSTDNEEFEQLSKSGKINSFIKTGFRLLEEELILKRDLGNVPEAQAFGLIESAPNNIKVARLTSKGKDFFRWLILNEKKADNK